MKTLEVIPGEQIALEEWQEPQLESVACNICAALESDVISREGRLCLRRCRRCGLVYVSPRLAAAHIRRLYDRQYFQAGDAYHGNQRGYVGGYRDYLADQPYYLKTFRQRLRWLADFAGPGRRLLDVGCAAGYFMTVAREAGWQVTGVEPCAFVANYAGDIRGHAVFQGTLREANFPPESFDAVSLWDVLEHVTDPRGELDAIHRVLAQDGILVLETQNIASWLPRLLGQRWGHFGHHLHLFHFSPATITHLLHETGFQVLKITTQTAGKVCSLRFLVDKLRSFGLPLYSLLDRVLAIYPWLAGRSFYINAGDEMIVIARKKSPKV